MSYLAQRDSAEKTSKNRPNVLMAKNEDRDAVILYLSYQVQIAIGVGMLVNIAMLTKSKPLAGTQECWFYYLGLRSIGAMEGDVAKKFILRSIGTKIFFQNCCCHPILFSTNLKSC